MPGASSPANILVVAPDTELRQSLAFMLRAEGFDVETRTGWRSGDNTGRSQAMIMDHRSVQKGFLDNGVLAQLGHRLILLASQPPLPTGLERAILVQKPLLDQELVTALHAALGT